MTRLQAAFVVLLLAAAASLVASFAQAQAVREVARVSPIIGRQPLKRIALIPMVVHSSEDPGYLRDGLRDMFVSRLEQDGKLEVAFISDPNKATTDLASALATARAVGADFVLFGSFTRFGQGASLDMQCAAIESVDGRPPLRQIFVHAGDIASMIPDLDELVGKVVRFVNEFGAEVAAGPPTGSEFDDGNPAGVGPGGAPSTIDLLRRIEALEQKVRSLSAQP